MAYDANAMSLVEIGLLLPRRIYFKKISNDELKRCELDFLEEMRDDSHMKLAFYQRKMAQYYNIKVKKEVITNGRHCVKKGFPIFQRARCENASF